MKSIHDKKYTSLVKANSRIEVDKQLGQESVWNRMESLAARTSATASRSWKPNGVFVEQKPRKGKVGITWAELLK